jgi:hypothetical protein
LTSKHAGTIAPRPLEYREWLWAIDLSPYAENVLRTGKRISEQARAKMSLIHVVNEDSQAAPNILDSGKKAYEGKVFPIFLKSSPKREYGCLPTVLILLWKRGPRFKRWRDARPLTASS